MAKDPTPFICLEHRQSRRRTTLKTGKIIFNNGHCVVECTVRDLSDEGARLELPCHLDLPEIVTLNIPGGPCRDCEIVWLSNTELGVRFLGMSPPPADTGSRRTALLRRVRSIQSHLEVVQSHLNELRDDIAASADE
jgi:hypothetical protein